MNDQWQDKLRNRMVLHEEPAPEGLWEGIEQRIPVGKMPVAGVVGTRRHLWRWRAGAMAVAAAVAILLIFVVRFNTADNRTGELFTEEKVTTPPQVQPTTVEITPVEKKAERFFVSARSRPAATPETALAETELPVDGQPTEEIATSDSENEKSTIETEEEEEISLGTDQLLAMNENRDQQPSSKWQSGLSMSNIPGGTSDTYTGYGTLALTETVEEQYYFLANDTRERAYTDVRHHQPITLGLTLRYNINDRWSVASGVTYSLLSSELRAGSGNYYYDDKQTLHFIGVPLNLAYTFWQSPKLSAYLSTGALVEKNVAGRLTSKYYIDNQLETTTREKISMHQLQWSANAAIGLGYRISNHVGLYAEPGISYYFRNGSHLETIYSDNPFNFNLQIGLRFTLGE
ncbi:porin family protein [Dysgonomonadaceae bacterium zrk40]|nr:porin family protein [Dysgonomonadaceae bacterium zrk40]